MPRDAITLADVREAAIEIFCEPFARRGRYNLERLIAKHGADIRLAELLTDHCRLPEGAFSSASRIDAMRGEASELNPPSTTNRLACPRALSPHCSGSWQSRTHGQRLAGSLYDLWRACRTSNRHLHALGSLREGPIAFLVFGPGVKLLVSNPGDYSIFILSVKVTPNVFFLSRGIDLSALFDAHDFLTALPIGQLSQKEALSFP
jgi:hypothetical protein